MQVHQTKRKSQTKTQHCTPGPDNYLGTVNKGHDDFQLLHTAATEAK